MALDWTAIGSIAGVVGMSAVVGGAVNQRAIRWRSERRLETHAEEMMRVAMFGRVADGAVPAIAGLVADHASLEGRVAAVERLVRDVGSKVDTLVQRTEANGGASMKDQLNRIEKKLGAEGQK